MIIINSLYYNCWSMYLIILAVRLRILVASYKCDGNSFVILVYAYSIFNMNYLNTFS